MAVSSHVFNEPGFENPIELQTFDVKSSLPQPAMFNARHDIELEKLTGVGKILLVSREADLIK
eukprot:snap_masked-scaffold_9-processed-gene-5.26-mRNA-1 protein AED:1.00 eAED:1.00 QI:0/0/0/0/1/1/2/0/62